MLDKDKAKQAANHVNCVYGHDTVTVNHAQFCFRRFHSGNFDGKDAPRYEGQCEKCRQNNGYCRVRQSCQLTQKTHGPHFYLRIIAESRLNRPIAEANGDK